MDKHEAGHERDREQRNPQVAKSVPAGEETATMSAPATDIHAGGVQGTMTSAVSATEQVGSGLVGGVTHVAADLVHGVGAVGGEVVTVVRDTANTAIAGVGSVGETAVHTVTGLLADLVGGLRDIGSAAMRGRESSGTAAGEADTRREHEATH